MERDAIDRLLDEGLKSYSRVEPPEDFTGRVRAASLHKQTRPGTRRWWIWVAAPLAAVALFLLALVLRWPGPGQTAVSIRVKDTARTVAPAPAPNAGAKQPPLSDAIVAARKHLPQASRRARQVLARRSIHVLSPEELADVRLPAVFLQPDSNAGHIEMKDLAVPELKVRPIEIEPMEPGGSAQTR